MVTVERVVAIADATGAKRCVVCGAHSDDTVDLEFAASDAVIDASSSKLVGRAARACHACNRRQEEAKRYGQRAVLASMFAMPVVALAVALLADRDDVVGAGIGAALGFVIVAVVGKVVARRRARLVPLLLLGADEESMMVQVNGREALPGDAPSAPRPPRVSHGLVWIAMILVTIAVCGVASTGALSPRRVLVIDSPRDAVRVVIDGDAPMNIAAGGRFNLKIRSGQHRYRVDYVDIGASETGTFEVGVMKDTLITTDESACYLVWVTKRGEAVGHGTGRVRWTPLEDAKSSQRCE